MLKRTIALLLALACLLSLTGCYRRGRTASASRSSTRGRYTHTVPQAQEAQETQPPVQEASQEEDDPWLLPTLDAVCPQMVFEKFSGSNYGDVNLTYVDSTGGGQVRSSVEAYIAVLEGYGYTLVHSDELAKSDYAYRHYWLKSSDSSLETLSFDGHTCHLFIESTVDPKYNFRDISIYYSPSIIGYYTGDADLPGGGGGGGTPVTPNDPGGNDTTIRCSKCGGDGEISCTNCGGLGYKESRVSTPNYSGSGPRYETVKEICFKCHRTGSTTCPRCGGEGRHS